jgi:hypothetical protein
MKLSQTNTNAPPKWILSLTLAVGLAACGGSSAPPVQLVTANATATISGATPAAVATAQAIVTAVLNKTFTFPAVPAMGTTAATTVALAGTGAAPTVAIASGGKKASGTMSFGSCIFKITTSDFVAPSPLAVGNTVTIDPCSLNLQTVGAVANGTPVNTNATLSLGTVVSDAQQIVASATGVSISSTGVVTVGGSTIATVPTKDTTGGTGGG